MVRLSHCWILIESIVIPQGLFLRWFYLSFYIHPCFLALLQIFLWIRELYTFVLFLLVFLFKISTFVITFTLRFLNLHFSNKKKETIITPNYNHHYYNQTSYAVCVTTTKVIYEEDGNKEEIYHFFMSSDQFDEDDDDDSGCVMEDCGIEDVDDNGDTDQDDGSDGGIGEGCEIEDSPLAMSYGMNNIDDDDEDNDFDSRASVMMEDVLNSKSRRLAMGYEMNNIDDDNNDNNDDDDGGTMKGCGIEVTENVVNNIDDNGDDVRIKEGCGVKGDDQNYPPQPLSDHEKEEKEELDPFYKEYLKAMKWFDALNHDRLYATKMMKKKQHLSENVAIMRRTGKSLEKDLELVYVAQSCLSWEALLHQYRKVEAIVLANLSSNNNNFQNRMLFHKSISGRFQKFQILLERFLEDERSGGTRYSNYVHRKISLQSLLLVPPLSGWVVEDGKLLKKEGIEGNEVLKVIEKCINTFWLYVKVDSKRLNPWRNCPILEDPRDFDLLFALKKSLKKKELGLKGMEGKRRCWLRKAVHNQDDDDDDNIEVLCTRIEMKLVGRVLKLPIISTSHLKWCQHKIGNIHFNKDGKVVRAHTTLLFPC